jgi:hypothetical protein
VVPGSQSAVCAVQLGTCFSSAPHEERTSQLQVPPGAAQQRVPVHCATLSPTPTEVHVQIVLDFEQSKRPHTQSFLPWQHTTSPPIVAALHSRTAPIGGALGPHTQNPATGIAHGGADDSSELSQAVSRVKMTKNQGRIRPGF